MKVKDKKEKIVDLFFKSTKIVATIGPSSSSVPVLLEMMKAGMNVARINFSHGTHESNLAAIENVRLAGEKFGLPVMVFADFQGPKIRVSEMENPIEVKKGDKLVIGQDFFMDTDVTEWLRSGHRLLIEDGLLEFKILKIRAKSFSLESKIYCEALSDGTVRSRKTINLPDTDLRLPILTSKDLADLKFVLNYDVDAVALSFVRDAADLQSARKAILKYLPKGAVFPKIIVKIERPQAVENFEEILAAADAVMIARGDLGVEMPPAKVPVVQKKLVAACVASAKPVIVATQMLDSMIKNPRPTRAEVSDVANAVIDRADAVMLSGETSTGDYPVECVRIMAEIIQEVETSQFRGGQCLFLGEQTEAHAAAVAGSACQLARGVQADAIIGATESGYTARFLSHQRPEAPIFMLSADARVCRQMALLWGVQPIMKKWYTAILDLLDGAITVVKRAGFIRSGQRVVLVAGRPSGSRINILEVKVVE